MSYKDALNYEAITKAKIKHNHECPFGGIPTEVHLNPYDIDRLDWEEGEIICGLTVQSNEKVNPGLFRVVCDGEKPYSGPKIAETVSVEDLVPA